MASALHDNSTLTKLRLGRTGLGDDGAVLIAESLEMNSSLLYLGLRDCQIGSWGLQRIAQALCFNSTLSTLALSGNRMTRSQGQLFIRLFDVNSSITSLSIQCDDYSSKVDDAVFDLTMRNLLNSFERERTLFLTLFQHLFECPRKKRVAGNPKKLQESKKECRR